MTYTWLTPDIHVTYTGSTRINTSWATGRLTPVYMCPRSSGFLDQPDANGATWNQRCASLCATWSQRYPPPFCATWSDGAPPSVLREVNGAPPFVQREVSGAPPLCYMKERCAPLCATWSQRCAPLCATWSQRCPLFMLREVSGAPPLCYVKSVYYCILVLYTSTVY